MSLGQRILGARKLVLKHDPAINHDKISYGDYVDANYDYAILKPGLTGDVPTVFVIEPLTRRQKGIVSRFDGYQRYETILRCGLRDVTSYFKYDEHGQKTELVSPERKDLQDLGRLVSDEWLDKANFFESDVEFMWLLVRCLMRRPR